jgi:hypothetical protein
MGKTTAIQAYKLLKQEAEKIVANSTKILQNRWIDQPVLQNLLFERM